MTIMKNDQKEAIGKLKVRGSEISGVSFKGCNLSKEDFSTITFRDCDFRNAILPESFRENMQVWKPKITFSKRLIMKNN